MVRKHYRMDSMTFEILTSGRKAAGLTETSYVCRLIEVDLMHPIGIPLATVTNVKRQLAGINNNLNQALRILSGVSYENLFRMLTSAQETLQLLNFYLSGRSGRMQIDRQYRMPQDLAQNVSNAASETDRSESEYIRELIRRVYIDSLSIKASPIVNYLSKLTLAASQINYVTRQINSMDFTVYHSDVLYRMAYDTLSEVHRILLPIGEKLQMLS